MSNKREMETLNVFLGESIFGGFSYLEELACAIVLKNIYLCAKFPKKHCSSLVQPLFL